MSIPSGTTGITPELLAKIQALVDAHEKAKQGSEPVPTKLELNELFDELPEKGDYEIERLERTDFWALEDRLEKEVERCLKDLPELTPGTSSKWKSLLETVFRIYPYSERFLLTENYQEATGGENKMLKWDIIRVTGTSDIVQVMRCLERLISNKAKSVNFSTGAFDESYYISFKDIWDTVKMNQALV